jgi:hypothetical protein
MEPVIHDYTAPIQPFSYNAAYFPVRNNPHRRFLCAEAKELKEKLKEIFTQTDINRGKPNYTYYKTEITIRIPILPRGGFYYQSGPGKRLRGNDLTNYTKFIEDALFEYLGVDDGNNIDITLLKRISSDINWHIDIKVMEGYLPE